MITESLDNTINQETQSKDDEVVLEEEIGNIFVMFSNSLKTAALFIEVFRIETDEDIEDAKLMIAKYKPKQAQSIINSLTKIAELNAKNQQNKEFIDERVKAFVEIQATKDFYNSRSQAKYSSSSFVDRYANRDGDNQNKNTGWCSVL